MTLKTFKKLLIKVMKDGLDFEVVTNKDRFFEQLEENEVAFFGYTEDDVFAIEITKVVSK